jgi:hypothetical protein
MVTEIEIAWFSGLFEGEGSFWFANGKPKGLIMTMTDEDVLLKVQSLFGGNLNRDMRKNAPEHWKDAWKWSLGLKQSMELVPKMLPYLASRRTKRAEEMLSLGAEIAKIQADKLERVLQVRSEILDLHKKGTHTHKQIAAIHGIDRSYVSHIIAGKRYTNV